MTTISALFIVAQTVLAPDSGEVHPRNIRQLTFGGQNAEAYFSPSGQQLVFQRTAPDSTCDQLYLINVDGTGLRHVSPGGRQTCGYFYQDGQRIFFSSTHHLGPTCPTPPDYSQGYVWKLYDYDIYSAENDGSDVRRLTDNPSYDAEGT